VTPPATPVVAALPVTAACPGASFGACTAARFPVNEYALTLAGSEVLALHVLDGLAAAEAPADVAPLSRAGAGATIADARVVGTRVARGDHVTFVVAAAASGPAAAPVLAYDVSGAVTARHVVFDAPEDEQGRASVTATALPDGQCHLVLEDAGPRLFAGRPVVFVVSSAAAGCVATEDVDAPSDGRRAPGVAPPGAEPRARASGGCGCALAPASSAWTGVVSLAVALAALGRRRVRGRRRCRPRAAADRTRGACRRGST
jgi:hypothetical protein